MKFSKILGLFIRAIFHLDPNPDRNVISFRFELVYREFEQNSSIELDPANHMFNNWRLFSWLDPIRAISQLDPDTDRNDIFFSNSN